ncbi:hypothetical protein PHLCEN_2v9348, partial [Hermanssonia centrifuga]
MRIWSSLMLVSNHHHLRYNIPPLLPLSLLTSSRLIHISIDDMCSMVGIEAGSDLWFE